MKVLLCVFTLIIQGTARWNCDKIISKPYEAPYKLDCTEVGVLQFDISVVLTKTSTTKTTTTKYGLDLDIPDRAKRTVNSHLDVLLEQINAQLNKSLVPIKETKDALAPQITRNQMWTIESPGAAIVPIYVHCYVRVGVPEEYSSDTHRFRFYSSFQYVLPDGENCKPGEELWSLFKADDISYTKWETGITQPQVTPNVSYIVNERNEYMTRIWFTEIGYYPSPVPSMFERMVENNQLSEYFRDIKDKLYSKVSELGQSKFDVNLDWKATMDDMAYYGLWYKGEAKTIETRIPRNMRTFLFQLVGTCGLYKVFTAVVYRRSYDIDGKSKCIDNTEKYGFRNGTIEDCSFCPDLNCINGTLFKDFDWTDLRIN